ncbi:MAG: 2-amino-4-hydroxy-6-hydroxymethyldihydropteridine diphosphokinase, partial [Muribaculaceae bacterium]|nr:2-amino-4-hydroxy-6-hydroxymethyldihydropteridine diphosphokinase [Muribaculaceae bacterium]
MTSTGKQEAVICIGSNCGDRNKHVEAAVKWLSGILRDFRHSHIYATPDCQGGQLEYMNAVCIGKTSLSYSRLAPLCKEYELKNGRTLEAREIGAVPVAGDGGV